MKRKAAFFLVIITTILILALGIGVFQQMLAKRDIVNRISVQPDFMAETLYGGIVSSDQLFGQKPVVLTYFNTECYFCQIEIDAIKLHKGLQEKALIVLISDEPIIVLEKFAKSSKLTDKKDVEIYHDRKGEVKDYFGIHIVPTTFIYDNEAHLVKTFNGQISADFLHELISNGRP